MIKSNMRVIWVLILTVLFAVTLSACGSGGSGGNSEGNVGEEYTSNNKILSQLVISMVDVNVDESTLTILGENFDNGYELVVTLGDDTLNIISYTANEIIADLPGAADLDGDFLLTVKTGSDTEHFDAYGLTIGEAEPGALLNQLLVRDVEGDDVADLPILNIFGHNFDNGEWPPVVIFNDIPLVVDVDNSNSELLVVNLPEEAVEAITNSMGGVLLTVHTGDSNENHDVYELVRGLDYDNNLPPPVGTTLASPSTELVCQRTDRVKVPLGEYCCPTATGKDLCWKSGPKRDVITSDDVAYYFELTKDYEIPITAFFADPPPVKLPHAFRWKRERKRKTFAALADELSQYSDNFTPEDRKWDFLRFTEGTLIIRKGYRFDGASRGWDKIGFLYATFLFDLRAALVHDAFYDLLRLCYIPCSKKGKAPIFGGYNDYRDLADNLFYLIARQDGHGKAGVWPAWRVLRDLGWTKAKLDPEDSAAWRFHTLADASVSARGVDMVIDDEGNKTLTMSCAVESDVIELDASGSRPIAELPRNGKYQKDLHETTWEWSLNGENLVPMNKNNIGIYLDRNELKTTLTLDKLTGKGLQTGVSSIITLHTDKGKDTSKGFLFENEDEVEIMVDFDTEHPVITGISEPITVWPPHHMHHMVNPEYKTFTIDDFVTSVSDNCTALSLDDLVITQVTSDEPEDGKGNGHTKNDIVIAPDGKSVDLRIERQGKGNDRVYTIYIQAVDERGNVTTEPFHVQVPHHKY